MAWPVKGGYPITTAYGIRGGMWSCNENSSGGIHTGVDMLCPKGTPLLAAVAGQIRHRSYGSAFGSGQFAISPDPDQPYGDGEVFYAHGTGRLPDGLYVSIGEVVGYADMLGNATGPHLHFEFHPSSKNAWNCGVHANPDPVLQHGGGGAPPPSSDSHTVYLSKLHYGQYDSDSVKHLQWVLNEHPLSGGETLPISGNYLSETDEEVRLCQQQHGYGNDPVNQSYVGPSQAEHLFGGLGYTVVNDL